MRMLVGALVFIGIMSCRMGQAPLSEIKSFNSSIEDGEPEVYKIRARYPVLDADGKQIVNQSGVAQYAYQECTMTAYSPSHGITAAHCVVNKSSGLEVKPSDLHVIFPDNSFAPATQVKAHQGYIVEWRDAAGNITPRGMGVPSSFDRTKDVAVVAFDNQFTSFKKLAAHSPDDEAEKVKIVGFGYRGFYLKEPVGFIVDKDLHEVSRDFRQKIGSENSDLAKFFDDFRNAYQNMIASKDVSEPWLEKAKRLNAHIEKIKSSSRSDDGRNIKRSGSSTMAGKSSEIKKFLANQGSETGNELLILSGRFLENVFKDEIDRELFDRFGVYAPDESTSEDASSSNLAASFGDSGGPMLNEAGHIVGVASHCVEDLEKRALHTAYVNLHSDGSKEFFAGLKDLGWPLPEVASESSDKSDKDSNDEGAPSLPGPGSGKNGPSGNDGKGDTPEQRQKPVYDMPVNQNMAAALASTPNPDGHYHLLISMGLSTNAVWICENITKLSDCGTYGNASQTAGRSDHGPLTRYNFKTDQPVDITRPFAIMTETPAGFISGIIVEGVKR